MLPLSASAWISVFLHKENSIKKKCNIDTILLYNIHGLISPVGLKMFKKEISRKQWRLTHCICLHVMSLHSSLVENTSLRLFCGRGGVFQDTHFWNMQGSWRTIPWRPWGRWICLWFCVLVYGVHKRGLCLPVSPRQEAVTSICPVDSVCCVPLKESRNTAAL